MSYEFNIKCLYNLYDNTIRIILKDHSAEDSILEAGDIILEVSKNFAICSAEDIASFFPKKQPGAKVELISVNFPHKKERKLSVNSSEKRQIIQSMNDNIFNLIEKKEIFPSDYIQLAREVMKVAQISQRVFLVRGTDRGRKAWHYLLIDEDKYESLEAASKTGSLDVKDYGKILKSAFGEEPPQKVKDEILDIAFKSVQKSESESTPSKSIDSLMASSLYYRTILRALLVKFLKNT